MPKKRRPFLATSPAPDPAGVPLSPARTLTEAHAITHALGERIKELRCMYGLTRLIEQRGRALDELLAQAVELLPPAWQYPEHACARITLSGRCYTTANFRATRYRQAAAIRVTGQPPGEVEVFYLRRMPQAFEGPFLREERDLIDAIASRLASLVDYVQTEQMLRVERQALADANAALRALMATVETGKREMRDAIATNVESVLLPIIDALERESNPRQRPYCALLRRHLEQIASPFVNDLARRHASLTPTELRICSLIRSGMGTKEIGQMLHRSALTIKRHREQIRRKLGLTNAGANLSSYLAAQCPTNANGPDDATMPFPRLATTQRVA